MIPDESKFVAFDVETTGISKTSRIVEIAAVRFDMHAEYESFQALVNPGTPIPYPAQRIHGISDDMVRGCPHAKEVLNEFNDFIEDDDLLIAHYAEFDVGIIANELRRFDMPHPRNLVFDSCRLARKFLDFPNYKLDTLRSQLGPHGTDRHRALGDCLAVIEVIRATVAASGRDSIGIRHLMEWGASVKRFDYFQYLSDDMPTDKAPLLDAFREKYPVTITYQDAELGPAETDVIIETFYWYKDDLYMEAFSTITKESLALKVDEMQLMSNE